MNSTFTKTRFYLAIRRSRPTKVYALMLALGFALGMIQGTSAATWYVATTGNDNNAGTLASPFATISKGILVAHYGDTIYLRAGDYREAVGFGPPGQGLPQSPGLQAGGGSLNNMLTIRNYGTEVVTLKGSVIVGSWLQFSSDAQKTVWRVTRAAPSSPDWCPECPSQVFVDGRLLGHVGWNTPLSQYPWNGNAALSAEALAMLKDAAGFSVLQQNVTHMTNWSFYHDVANRFLYIALPTGINPATSLIEVSTNEPIRMGYDYVRLKGLKVRHSNLMPVTGTWPGVALSCYSSIEDCDIQWCDFLGVSVKDGSTVTNCLIANNAMIGLNAVGTNVHIVACRFLTNGYLQYDFRGEAAGAKIIGAPQFLDGSIYDYNEFGWNHGAGLWFDTMTVRDVENEALARPVIVRNNFTHDNDQDGFFIEHMSGTRIYNNISVRNKVRALYLSAATYSRVFNNTLLAPFGSYVCLDVNWRGVPFTEVPHHIWITNNIVGTDETASQVVGGHGYGNCAGATDLFFDYNCWIIRGTLPGHDYFTVGNYDKDNSGPGCSLPPSQCVYWLDNAVGWRLCSEGVDQHAYVFRLDWPGWQAFGHDPHSISPILDAATIDTFFVNRAADDYRIRLNSPAAAAGKNLYGYFQNDFGNQPRPASGNFSIGAYQASGDTVTLAGTTKLVREAGSATLTLSRTGNLTDQVLTVQISVGGEAGPGVDYQVLVNGVMTTIAGGQFSATFPANVLSLPLTVQSLGDSIQELRETVTLTVLSGATYLVGAANTHTLSILDSSAMMVGGLQHSLAIRTDQNGAVWAWGRNLEGALGDGTFVQRLTHVTVNGLSQVVDLAADSHSVAVKADGTLWTWGANDNGKLGDGLSANRNQPYLVSSMNSVVAAAAGRFHTLALKSDGTVWAWGLNSSGQLGDGTTTTRPSPVQVQGINNAVAIAAGYYHSLALLANGSVVGWGNNSSGQLGDGTTLTRLSPVTTFITGVGSMTARNYKSHAIRYDGTAWGWGQNGNGELGDGTVLNRSLPVQMAGLNSVKSIASGYNHTVVLKYDGTVWACGYNSNGQVGDATFTSRLTAVPCSGLTLNPAYPNSIAAGQHHSLGSMYNIGTMWSWGLNGNGQLGNNSTVNSSVPVQPWD